MSEENQAEEAPESDVIHEETVEVVIVSAWDVLQGEFNNLECVFVPVNLDTPRGSLNIVLALASEDALPLSETLRRVASAVRPVAAQVRIREALEAQNKEEANG